MARQANTKRNEFLVTLREKNNLSFGEIGNLLNIDRKTAWDIWARETKRKKPRKRRGVYPQVSS